jgi:hypothetical protein
MGLDLVVHSTSGHARPSRPPTPRSHPSTQPPTHPPTHHPKKQCKPGDRVQVMGVYKALAGQHNGSTSGACARLFVCLLVPLLTHEIPTRLT